MLTAPPPTKEALQLAKDEAAQEKTAYRILMVLGGLLCIIALLLEIFTGPSWEDKGMWSTFSLVGFGIAVVFGLILKRSNEVPVH